MKCCIVGGGVAGLSTALFLKRALRPEACIRVVTATPRPDASAGAAAAAEIGVGVWSTALAALGAADPKLLSELVKNGGRFMRRAGYRSSSGRWLAESELGGQVLDDGLANPALLFLSQGRLETLLRQAAYRAGVQVEELKKPINFSCLDTLRRENQFVVGCDGRDSIVRLSVLGSDAQTKLSGYRVFRGNSNSDFGNGEASFQTWGSMGNMQRFACVPLMDGRNVWFATVAANSISSMALGNAEAQKRALLEAFQPWHEPIHRLIKSTDAQDILSEQAQGLDLPTATALLPNDCNVVLVGDAGHCADPVLAQGLSIAIEDAAELAFQLQRLDVDSSNENVNRALRQYERKRKARIKNLFRTSSLVFTLANSGPIISALRNAILLGTPNFAKRIIFNKVMEASIRPPPDLPVFNKFD